MSREFSTVTDLYDVILTRTRSTDYLSLNIVNYAPDPYAFYLWLVKELIDNALDADANKIEVDYLNTRADENGIAKYRISVQGNGRVFSEEKIRRVFLSFDYYAGSKEYWKRPSRGFLGNALKVVLGAPYALATLPEFEKFQPSPLEIASGDYKVSVTVDDPKGRDPKPMVATVERLGTPVKGSRISFRVPYSVTYGAISLWKKTGLATLLKQYLLFNPDMSFHWRDEQGRRSLQLRNPSPVKRYQQTKPTSIHWLSEGEFLSLVEALTGSGKVKLSTFLKSFGIQESIASEMLKRNASLLNQISTSDLVALYKSIGEISPRINAKDLGRIGRENLRKSMAKVLGKSSADLEYTYSEAVRTSELEGHDAPFVLEVAAAVYLDDKTPQSRAIWWGINHSPIYVDPTGREPLLPNEILDAEQILDNGKVKADDPVLIVVHIMTPTWRALNQSKTRIDMRPYSHAIADCLKEVCAFYSEYKTKRSNPKREKSEATLELESLIAKRHERFQAGHIFGRDERQTRNTLWYIVRNKLIGAIKMKRRSFLAAVNEICKRMGGGDLSYREKLGIIAGERGVLYFKGDAAAVSFDNLDWLKKQGSDVLFIEKEGVAELMAPYAEDKGIAILNSRGNATLYVKQLLDFAEKSGANVFILTDLDSAGLYIAQVASSSEKVVRIGLDKEMVEYFGFELEDLQEEYEDKRERPAFLSQLSLEDQQLVGKKRVELDALLARLESPKQLWDYLVYRMESIRPIRNLRRSISISEENPPTSRRVEGKLAEIRGLLELQAKDATKKVLEPYEKWRGRLANLSVKRVEDDIKRAVSDSVESKLDITVVLKKLDEAIEALGSAQSPSRRPTKSFLQAES